jgi:hypothetical protein
MKPALVLKEAGAAQDLEDQGVAENMAEEDVAEENVAEEKVAGDDDFS